MILVSHRRNTVAQLRDTPRNYGVEVDIRSDRDRLIIHHDPFADGEDFENWLENYSHRLLILNLKEEGLEQRLLALMAARKIDEFFFLDQSFPFLVKTARGGEKRTAVRVSEFESIRTAESLAGLVDWIWLDCFTRFPVTGEDAARLRSLGFRLCLVSPELQGRPDEIPALRALLRRDGVDADAVCTKRPDLWEKAID